MPHGFIPSPTWLTREAGDLEHMFPRHIGSLKLLQQQAGTAIYGAIINGRRLNIRIKLYEYHDRPPVWEAAYSDVDAERGFADPGLDGTSGSERSQSLAGLISQLRAIFE